MMEPTTLEGLLATPGIELISAGFRLVVPDSWIVSGENRLSYASAIRLAECCREYHWKRDLEKLAPNLDSIVVRCDAKFTNPVILGSHIELLDAVTRVGKRSYECVVTIRPAGGRVFPQYARVELTNVFYDPVSRRSVDPPSNIVDVLRSLLAEEETP